MIKCLYCILSFLLFEILAFTILNSVLENMRIGISILDSFHLAV